jgi:hypothetical protein
METLVSSDQSSAPTFLLRLLVLAFELCCTQAQVSLDERCLWDDFVPIGECVTDSLLSHQSKIDDASDDNTITQLALHFSH